MRMSLQNDYQELEKVLDREVAKNLALRARLQRVEALAKKWREPIEQGYIGDETRLLANCADELEKALK
jgi:hypothetical protein